MNKVVIAALAAVSLALGALPVSAAQIGSLNFTPPANTWPDTWHGQGKTDDLTGQQQVDESFDGFYYKGRSGDLPEIVVASTTNDAGKLGTMQVWLSKIEVPNLLDYLTKGSQRKFDFVVSPSGTVTTANGAIDRFGVDLTAKDQPSFHKEMTILVFTDAKQKTRYAMMFFFHNAGQDQPHALDSYVSKAAAALSWQ
ncbi:MAG TPA: hypothetical protein VMT80_02605 [Candidatus Paceibacterota bacterium]|nr:hypothetical protein [Candidatus Paceibacterota bacterium]